MMLCRSAVVLLLLLSCFNLHVSSEHVSLAEQHQQDKQQEQDQHQKQSSVRRHGSRTLQYKDHARPMTLDFFKTLLWTAVGVKKDDDDTSEDGDDDKMAEADWKEHTEWNWNRSFDVERKDGKSYPFIICDDSSADESSVDRKRKVVAEAVGIDISREDADSMLSEHFASIYNTNEMSCYCGNMNGTKAWQLSDFIIQPLSFLMKINAGTIGFTDADFESGLIEYAIYFCPGFTDASEAWALDALQTLVPLIPELVKVDQAAMFEDNLLKLQDKLTAEPTFCDELLVNSDNINSQDAGDYIILSFNTTGSDLATSTCFTLLSFALAYAPEVCYIERRERFTTNNEVAVWISQSGVTDETPFFDVGIAGEGQIVAVSDTGLDLDNCYFRDKDPITYGTGFDPNRRKVVQYFDYVNRGEVVNGHGTHVCGTIAGHKSEDGVTSTDGFVDGVAKNAQLAFVDIGTDDATGGLMVPAANTLLNPGKRAGARIHSASWGSTSIFYTNMDRDFDRYIHDDESFLILIAAGNDGPNPRTVGSPALAKNILSVGASNSVDAGTSAVDHLAGFSSRGPSQDMRIKPDIVAPGAYILSAGSRNEPSCDPPSVKDLPAPGKSSSMEFGILSLQGTSMATPVTSGHAALVRQYFVEGWHGDGTKSSSTGFEPTGTLVKAVMINGAQPLAGYAVNQVDAKQGFGRLSLIDSLPLEGKNDLEAGFLDQETILQGETKKETFTLSSSKNKTCPDAMMSVTLVWADPPGYVGCLNCVLNDLDLFVVQTKTDGTRIEHYPNGGTAKDSVNNVERCRFQAEDGDSFEVIVTAARLEGFRQTYAMSVVYGCLNHRVRSGEATEGTTSAAATSRITTTTWQITFVAVVSLAQLLMIRM